MILTIERDDEPLIVHIDWTTCDDQFYGLIAHTRDGRAVALTEAEENDALEKIYSEMPSVNYYEIY